MELIKKFKMIIFKKEIIRPLKYASVAIGGIFVNYFILFLLYELFQVYYLIAAAIAIEIAIISNFILNHIWTFKDRRKEESAILKFLKFNLICLGGLAINLSILRFLKETYGFNVYFAELFGIMGGFLWNFSLSNFWAWKK
jgi:dolichol-phosphate mannosyltransferase